MNANASRNLIACVSMDRLYCWLKRQVQNQEQRVARKLAVAATFSVADPFRQLRERKHHVGRIMPPYFVAFLDELKRHEHDAASWQFIDDGQRRTLTLAARHSCVGPLVLYDEGEELTLEFGTKYHCHFDGFKAEACETNRMNDAAKLAADCVDRILHERIGVAVHFNDCGCMGASLIYLDESGLSAENLASSTAGIYGGMIRTERFLWTGPITNPT